eukprot:366170-Amphidinium_carterae.1
MLRCVHTDTCAVEKLDGCMKPLGFSSCPSHTSLAKQQHLNRANKTQQVTLHQSSPLASRFLCQMSGSTRLRASHIVFIVACVLWVRAGVNAAISSPVESTQLTKAKNFLLNAST